MTYSLLEARPLSAVTFRRKQRVKKAESERDALAGALKKIELNDKTRLDYRWRTAREIAREALAAMVRKG